MRSFWLLLPELGWRGVLGLPLLLVSGLRILIIVSIQGGWYFPWLAVVLYILLELALHVVACWPGGRGLASMVSKLETIAYKALLFPSKTKLLPSVYQISSGLVRGSSKSPSRGFGQWSKVSRQEWKAREPSGVGRRVAELRTSQGDIVRPGFSINTTWYLRILWSDIHKWPLPFRSCFTWWLVKMVSLPPKDNFKASSIKIAIAARFKRQGSQPWVVGQAS